MALAGWSQPFGTATDTRYTDSGHGWSHGSPFRARPDHSPQRPARSVSSDQGAVIVVDMQNDWLRGREFSGQASMVQ